jgi:lactate dehydrogenase-like 2-hydroxyacid dehydrogenase
MNEIAQYNHQHFFSDNFFNLITSELRTNLTVGLESLENTNTGLRYIDIRKLLAKLPNGKDVLIYGTGRTRKEIIKVLTVARKYYNCYLKATKK